MEDYNKIIESLSVKFSIAKRVKILEPVTVSNYYDVENTVILLNRGEMAYGADEQTLTKGDILFVPSGKSTKVTYGAGKHDAEVQKDLSVEMSNFFSSEDISVEDDSFCFVTFDTKVFDSVNFFQSLDISSFHISKHDKIATIIREIINESKGDSVGRERIIRLDTEKLVVEIMRFVLENELFVEQLATNATYFKDPRLLDIFAHIKDNLEGDLTNKALADIANVSEDYVGQYFKMLTGINPQDYIEYQRMEKSVFYLRTTKKSIREIGVQVGYKDTAYFCRRFKMMFGISAGKMRRREALISF